MNFSSDAMADFEGLLEVNRKICKQQMAEKASLTLPTNCAVLPKQFFRYKFGYTDSNVIPTSLHSRENAIAASRKVGITFCGMRQNNTTQCQKSA